MYPSAECSPAPVASSAPVRDGLGDYGSMPLEQGIISTYQAFGSLLLCGLLRAGSIG